MSFRSVFQLLWVALIILCNLNCQITGVTGGRTKVRQPGEIFKPDPRRSTVPGYSSLEIKTEPRGCEAFIDGEPIGITPLTRDLITPGNHRIRLTLAGYQDYETTLVFQKTKKRSMSVRMKERENEQKRADTSSEH